MELCQTENLYDLTSIKIGGVVRQVIYMSSLVSEDLMQLQAIVRASSENNILNGITGMTLYSDGNIVQVMEGKKDAVNNTFSRILADERHVGIHVLLEEKVDRREFEAWSFGFKNLKKSEVEKWGLKSDWFKATEKEISARAKRGNALSVLKSFFSD